MYCTKCSKDISSCTCPDLDQRLEAIGGSCHVILTFCSGCGSHAARCKCPHPKPPLEQRLKGKICGVIPRRYVHIPNQELFAIQECKVLNDCCTDELNKVISEGWRILAICPQPNQRRPDYIMGRLPEEK